MRGRTRSVLVHRIVDGVGRRQPDELVVEEPLSILLDDVLVATTMRTPGHDFELAAGFCLTDGLLAGSAVHTIRYCGTGPAVVTEFNVVSVDTGGQAPPAEPRLGTTGSACGLCGRDKIDELVAHLTPLGSTATFRPEAMAAMPDLMRVDQSLFARTGAVHAAAAIDLDGSVAVVREDIGRHNAVDKVVGRLLLDDRLPASTLALCVSGRASFEMVQKAWAAGMGTVVAVSAPSALAVELAEAAGITLAGFARPDQLNLYT